MTGVLGCGSASCPVPNGERVVKRIWCGRVSVTLFLPFVTFTKNAYTS